MILEVKGVSKNFGGLQALSNVTLDVPEGQILGLIGPNGAGKTTLFNCINGVYPPSEGQILFRGEQIAGMKHVLRVNPYLMNRYPKYLELTRKWPLLTREYMASTKSYHLAHKGMARTHQIVRPLNELSVRENVIVGGCFGRERLSLDKAGRVADEVMEFVGISSRAHQLAGSLNVAQKKRLEMARTLASRPYLLLLDEVLAGLNPTEIAQMVEIVRQIRDRGTTILMIEHVMHAVMKVSDQMLVLDFGEPIAYGTPQEVASNPRVIEAYLGDSSLAEQLSENITREYKGLEDGHSGN